MYFPREVYDRIVRGSLNIEGIEATIIGILKEEHWPKCL
jgi:hypothetical protein